MKMSCYARETLKIFLGYVKIAKNAVMAIVAFLSVW